MAVKWRTDWKVGDACFTFDSNRRVLERDAAGKPKGFKYRAHFAEEAIHGETSRSWLVGPSWARAESRLMTKIPKATGEGIYDAQMVDEAVWIHLHVHKIAEAVRYATYAQLKAVANIIGYEADDES